MMKIQIGNIKLAFNHKEDALIKAVCKKLNISKNSVNEVAIKRRSVDARKKPEVYFVYTVVVDVNQVINEKVLKRANATLYKPKVYAVPSIDRADESIDGADATGMDENRRPIIVGAGPAGLYCALVLAKAGLKPIVFERGEKAHKRLETTREFINTGKLNLNSNITFGEGGAGTFSDGKLNTGVKDKFGRKEFILKAMVDHGAEPEILYMAKPHVGTDYLVDVVAGIREEIIELGGEFYFNTLAEDIKCLTGEQTNSSVEENLSAVNLNAVNGHLCSLRTRDLLDDSIKEWTANQVVLATGHSARDTFNMLFDNNVSMESKPFAIGVRIEHPQEWINRSQYGDKHFKNPLLPTAEYKLTHQCDNGRGVYSFCMCPGGYVVNAASSEGMSVCNGMSNYKRDHFNANSALIVTVKKEDFENDHPLAGIRFQEVWERKVYDYNNSYDLVTESYESFYKNVTGKTLGSKNYLKDEFYRTDEVKSTCESGLIEGSISSCLPKYVSESLVDGIEAFGKKIKGFDHPKARLIGVETRTSSPVRIHRDENLVSNYKGLYPCGEGAGYAGGIMSAAIDGIKVAERIIELYK